MERVSFAKSFEEFENPVKNAWKKSHFYGNSDKKVDIWKLWTPNSKKYTKNYSNKKQKKGKIDNKYE